MIPINRTVVIKDLKEVKTMAGGFEVADVHDTDNRFIRAEVFKAAEDTPVKEGDFIYYDRNAGFTIDYHGARYKIVRDNDIVIVDRE